MKGLGIIDKIIFIANSLLALLLLLSYLTPYVNPNLFWPIAFLGLAFPILLLLNCVALIYWVIRLKKQFLLSAIVLLVGFNHIQSFVQFDNNPNKTKDKKEITVMSYNVRLFDLYNWSKNKQTRDKIFQLLQSENPDIICFQEFFYSKNKKLFPTLDTLPKFLNASNIHVETVKYIKASEQYFSIATFSKHPIVKKGKVNFDNNTSNACMFTDIKVNTDTIRIYNAHLASIRFEQSDYDFIDSVASQKTNARLDRVKKLSGRLTKAFKTRATQVLKITEHMQQSPYPIIFCTDLNDTPISYAYNQFTDLLSDAFIECGSGMGVTYNGLVPVFRIDYILHSKNFKATKFKTIKEKLSDHFPITTTLITE